MKIFLCNYIHFLQIFIIMVNHNYSATEELSVTQGRYIKRLNKHGVKYRDNLVLKRIHQARRRNATCMDGSDARYYISHQSDSNNWVIHLQSGGSCITKTECKNRANGPLGSSIPLDRTVTGEWLLSNDPSINPTFHTWNKVLIPYCSGDVFVGRQTRNSHPYRLPMFGHYILVSVVEDLIRKYNINRKDIKVKGYIDGGWFTLYPNYGENDATGLVESGLPKFFNTLTELFDYHWNGFADESCRKQMPKAAACLYGQLAIPYIRTPLYVMTVLWDSYQITQMNSVKLPLLNIPPASHKEIQYFSSFGNNTRTSIMRVLLDGRNGVFAAACYSHTFFTSCINGILCGHPNERVYSIKGQTAYGALTEWYTSAGKIGSYIDDADEEPSCNPSCCSVNCYKCRGFIHESETNSVEQYGKKQNRFDDRRIVYYSTDSNIKPKTLNIFLHILILMLLLFR